MGRRRSVMSESFKYELAKDLGFYDVVQREGWEGIRTKDAGNMVKRAIQIAEEHLAKQYTSSAPTGPSNYAQTSYTQAASFSEPGSGNNYSSHSTVHASSSSQSQGYGQGGYEVNQPVQTSYTSGYTPSYTTSHTSKAYNMNASFPYQNQPNAAVVSQSMGGSEQIRAAEPRSYFS